MREDMFKVIVERPRRGGPGDGVDRWRPADLEDGGPRHQSLRRSHTDHKSLNENLRPLERYLERNVGRHWDKVYAEISANLSSRNVVQQHVRDHLRHYVATRTAIVDGEIWDRTDRLYGGPVPMSESFQPFFVHPVSGMLLRNRHLLARARRRRERRKAAERETRLRRIDIAPMRQLHLLEGQWFEIRLEPIPSHVGYPLDLVYYKKLSKLEPKELYGRGGVYAASKRQLNHKELKYYGLLGG